MMHSGSPTGLGIGRWLTALAAAAFVLVALVPAPRAQDEWTYDPDWSEEKELAAIRRQIEENGWQWEAGPTGVSSIPPWQRQGYLGYIEPTPEQLAKAPTTILQPLSRDEIPASWDWRAMNRMTPAKDQGGCGSCWAFAAVGVLESLYRIRNGGAQLLFSEQQCISCNEYDYGCDGGNSYACYALWMDFGAVPSSCMPYQASDYVPCTQDECNIGARVDAMAVVPNIMDYMKTAVMTHPISIRCVATGPMFNYHGGCYAGPSGTRNHEILLCGWDDNACNGNGAWLIKNSWGGYWGESGYGWFQYGTCGVGSSGYVLSYTPFPSALLSYASHQVLDGGNGVFDPNETTQLRVTVANYGTTAATGVSGTLTALTPDVTVTDASATFPNVNSGATAASNAPHFSVFVGPSVPRGTLLEFELAMHCTQSDDSSGFFDFVAPITVLYENNFEASTAGWSSGAVSGENDWRWASFRTLQGHWDPRFAASGTKAYGNDLNEAGNWDGLYPNSCSNWLQSPAINCSGQTGVHLLFNRLLTVEEALYDDASILVNGTEIWHNQENDHHRDRVWTPTIFDISALADGQSDVRVKFQLAADEGMHFGGWNLDDFRVIATNASSQAVAEQQPGPRFLSVTSSPNPFTPLTSLRLEIPVSDPATRVQIFDASGRVVRTLHEGAAEPGSHLFSWTGKDDSGRPVAGGTYYCRVACAGRSASAKIVLVP